MLKDFDKSNWQSIRFDEIASSISEKVDPTNTDLETYIGLEHIDPESIHIKRYGQQGDVKGTKLRCYPGDIIFGRRRAYQRKAAIVKFDGFCSAHSLVLRANPETIDPKLFPFFLHSDLFMHRAVDISVGSLSPTINWKTLKHQEFLLPPKDQQAKIAELLWAMDDVVEKEKEVLEKYRILLLSRLKNYFNTEKNSEIRLDGLITEKPKYGANSPAIDFNNTTRYIRITDIGKFGNLFKEKVSAKDNDENYILKYGDFLLARTADPGRSYYYTKFDGRCSYAGYLIKFNLDLDKIYPQYLFYFTKTTIFQSWIHSTTKKGTVSNINAKEYGSLLIPYMSLTKQEKIVKIIQNDFEIFKKIESKLNQSQQLQKSLINEIFSV